MPGKQATVRLSVEDSLVRLVDLPPHERNHVLNVFHTALVAAERRVLRAENAAYDRLHPAGAPGSVLRPAAPRRASRRC
jgi:hypothetical protein